MRCRCFATFFCSDGVFVIFFRGVAVWTVPQCPPHYHTRNPLRNCNTFFPKKKTNLLCILTTSFNIARFEHENEMRRKALKQKKIWNPALFGIRNPLCWNPESSTRNPESTAWNPESKNVLDSLTWGDAYLKVFSNRNRAKSIFSKFN